MSINGWIIWDLFFGMLIVSLCQYVKLEYFFFSRKLNFVCFGKLLFAAIANYYRLSDLDNRNLFPHRAMVSELFQPQGYYRWQQRGHQPSDLGRTLRKNAGTL